MPGQSQGDRIAIALTAVLEHGGFAEQGLYAIKGVIQCHLVALVFRTLVRWSGVLYQQIDMMATALALNNHLAAPGVGLNTMIDGILDQRLQRFSSSSSGTSRSLVFRDARNSSDRSSTASSACSGRELIRLAMVFMLLNRK